MMHIFPYLIYCVYIRIFNIHDVYIPIFNMSDVSIRIFNIYGVYICIFNIYGVYICIFNIYGVYICIFNIYVVDPTVSLHIFIVAMIYSRTHIFCITIVLHSTSWPKKKIPKICIIYIINKHIHKLKM